MLIEHSNVYVEQINENRTNNVIIKNTLAGLKPIIIPVTNTNLVYQINCFTDCQWTAKYIEGLTTYEYPIYFNVNDFKYSEFYGIISNVQTERESINFYEVKFDLYRISNDYIYRMVSNNNVILPREELVFNATEEGRIYRFNATMELPKPIPTTMIKIYDGTNLISNVNNHDFISDCIIEYGNLRLKNFEEVYYWDNTWIYFGHLDYNMNFSRIGMVNNNIYLVGNQTYELTFDNGFIYYDGTITTNETYTEYNNYKVYNTSIPILEQEYNDKKRLIPIHQDVSNYTQLGVANQKLFVLPR